MNITVNSTELAQELRLLNKITPTKSPLPVLSYVLFQATDSLRLSATDLEVGMHTACPALITEPGSTMLPAKKLLDIIDQLPDAEVTIVSDDRNVKLTSGTFKSRLQTLPAKDFPVLPEVSGDVATLPAMSLKRAIDNTSYAIADKTQKYIMDGALLSLNGAVMAMVATDGKRLSLVTAARPEGPDMSVVLPSKTMEVLNSLTGDIDFSHSDRHLFFVSKGRLLFSRMLEGKFPSYQRIIPRNCDRSLTVHRGDLAAALKLVGVLADQDEQAVNIAIEPGHMTLTSSHTSGEGEETLEIDYAGEPFKVTVKGNHVLDFLNQATEARITVANKQDAPLLFTDTPDFINVIVTLKG
jgi:DNA polymerase-3 subunit beta